MSQQLIEQINDAKHLAQVVNLTDYKNEFSSIVKQIHPDVCKLTGVDDATSKMNLMRDDYVDGWKFQDDLGEFRTNGYHVLYPNAQKAHEWSLDNLKELKKLSLGTSFVNYLPNGIAQGDTHRLMFEFRALPLCKIQTLPEEHVRWVLNRLLGFVAWLESEGVVHAGLTLENVFIAPENHGLYITSFYHLARTGKEIKTISGKYKDWYPKELFKDKVATSLIDLEMVKGIAKYLLGDKSGSGVRLKSQYNADFVDFLIRRDTNAFEAFLEYREMLKSKFETKFHILNI